MSVVELLRSVAAQEVILSPDGENLRFAAPPSALTPAGRAVMTRGGRRPAASACAAYAILNRGISRNLGRRQRAYTTETEDGPSKDGACAD